MTGSRRPLKLCNSCKVSRPSPTMVCTLAALSSVIASVPAINTAFFESFVSIWVTMEQRITTAIREIAVRTPPRMTVSSCGSSFCQMDDRPWLRSVVSTGDRSSTNVAVSPVRPSCNPSMPMACRCSSAKSVAPTVTASSRAAKTLNSHRLMVQHLPTACPTGPAPP